MDSVRFGRPQAPLNQRCPTGPAAPLPDVELAEGRTNGMDRGASRLQVQTGSGEAAWAGADPARYKGEPGVSPLSTPAIAGPQEAEEGRRGSGEQRWGLGLRCSLRTGL